MDKMEMKGKRQYRKKKEISNVVKMILVFSYWPQTVSANLSICLRLGTLWSSMRTLSTRPWKKEVSYVFSLHRLNILYLRVGKVDRGHIFRLLRFTKPVLVLGIQESRHLLNWVPEEERGLRAQRIYSTIKPVQSTERAFKMNSFSSSILSNYHHIYQQTYIETICQY